ncbi:hypothetical protein BP00DRAFT_813 [Aspergillus indologenus CBS 114.80]|uniref:Secreted protein n=1 Tax=Aspergillus indologenus CBS 114.80 TaxID=1450541 RepID=A0A2V5IQY5_9EURO|nr:hypothetical protein BP00DRAFT_813 [Aspergillus indologenus CBS 114.80]
MFGFLFLLPLGVMGLAASFPSGILRDVGSGVMTPHEGLLSFLSTEYTYSTWNLWLTVRQSCCSRGRFRTLHLLIRAKKK